MMKDAKNMEKMMKPALEKFMKEAGFIKKEELEQETSPAKSKLLEIEIEEFELHLERNKRRIAGVHLERDRFLKKFKIFLHKSKIKLFNFIFTVE